MKGITTDVGSYKIRSLEHGRWYARTGGEFIFTLMWGVWGIEVCRCSEWAKYGACTRFFGFRAFGLQAQIFFGALSGFVPPEWIPRRASRWCLVTRKSLWPRSVLDDVLDAEMIDA